MAIDNNKAAQKDEELDQLTHQIGRVIASKRATRRMSQVDLAAASGVSRAAIALLERPGKGGDPKLSTLLSIARSLNTTLPMLLYEAQASNVSEPGSGEGTVVQGEAPLINPNTAVLLGALGGPLGLGLGALLGAIASRPDRAPHSPQVLPNAAPSPEFPSATVPNRKLDQP